MEILLQEGCGNLKEKYDIKINGKADSRISQDHIKTMLFAINDFMTIKQSNTDNLIKQAKVEGNWSLVEQIHFLDHVMDEIIELKKIVKDKEIL